MPNYAETTPIPLTHAKKRKRERERGQIPTLSLEEQKSVAYFLCSGQTKNTDAQKSACMGMASWDATNFHYIVYDAFYP